MASDLRLHEAYFLLANDARGRLGYPWRTMQACYGLAGAVLGELALRGQLDVTDGKARVVSATPTGDAPLDAALERITRWKRPRKLAWVVMALGQTRRYRFETGDRLADRGLVAREERRVLFWKMVRYPALPRADVERLVLLVTGIVEGGEATPRDVLLADIMFASDLHHGIYQDRRERKGAKARFSARRNIDTPIAEAVRRAIRESMAAASANVVP